MIKAKELVEFNKILQYKCDCRECKSCPLAREYTYYGCIKDHQENEEESQMLIDFVYTDADSEYYDYLDECKMFGNIDSVGEKCVDCSCNNPSLWVKCRDLGRFIMLK